MIATLTLALLLAPGQCWGPVLRLPVRQAPPVVLTRPDPNAALKARLAAERARLAAAVRARLTRAKGGCGCVASCECGADCPCLRTGKLCNDKCKCVLAAPRIEQVENFGLDAKELGKRGRYTLSGCDGSRRSVDRAAALRAIEKGSIPDESKLLRLTVIGDEPARKRVLADLDGAAAMERWRGKLLVQARPADDLYIRSRGFVSTGSPTLYVQAPDGKVLGRNLDGAYRGPGALAEALDLAQRRYDPAKDPDLWAQPKPGPAPAPSPEGPTVPPWAIWLCAGALLVYVLWRTGK